MRTLIPNRRASEITSFVHNDIEFSGQISYLPDGQPCEIFIEGGKPGSAIQAMARDSAVAISIAIQFGTPLEIIRNSMTRDDHGVALGPIAAFLDIITEKGN